MRRRPWVILVALLAAGLMIALAQLEGTWAQPQQNGLRETINTPLPSPTNGPTSTGTPTAGACTQRVLLQTLASYNGTTDTWLYAYVANFPQPRDGGLKVKGADAANVLVRFDLAGKLPADANIVAAELLFYVGTGDERRALDVSAFRVLRPWDLATASWRDASPGVRWFAPGCNGIDTDRVGAADDTSAIVYHSVYKGLDVTRSVRYWLQNPTQNYGWLIKGASASTAEYSLASSRNAVAEHRPVLRIDYDLCGATATSTATPNLTISATPSRTATPSGPTATPLPTTLAFSALEDSYLDYWEPLAPHGNATFANIRCRSEGVRKPLLRFDVGTLPPGAQISSATLRLRTSTMLGAAIPLSIKAYRLRRMWQEGTSTWNLAMPSQPWGVAGASDPATDYDATLLDSVNVSLLNHDYLWNVTQAVQAWANDPAQNDGLLLVGDPGAQVEYSFYSRHVANTAFQPSLVVTYSVPTPTATPSLIPSPTATEIPSVTPTSTPQGSRIIAIVYEDANRNGAPDAGERRIAGATVQLLTMSRGILSTQMTGQDGTCTFEGLPLGTYRLVEQNPAGLESSTEDEYRVYLGRVLTVTFGDYNPHATAR